MEKVILALESLFRPANGVRSTRSLVEIHNIKEVKSSKCQLASGSQRDTISDQFISNQTSLHKFQSIIKKMVHLKLESKKIQGFFPH